jgi:hypothetical protein
MRAFVREKGGGSGRRRRPERRRAETKREKLIDILRAPRAA